MPDYSKGKIYTIRCKTNDSLIYVGSTIQSLSKRIGQHREKSIKYPERWYKYIEDWGNWYIELYQLYSCNCKEELVKREGEVIREIGTLNKLIAGRTEQEYKKEYYLNNKEEIDEKNKLYYELNKHKKQEYHQINKDKINERHKQYYKEVKKN